MCLDSAGCGLACRSAGVIMAGCVLERPCACGRWLPVWLPGISLAAPMFERSGPDASGRERQPVWRLRPVEPLACAG
jgi:hypothetical protein